MKFIKASKTIFKPSFGYKKGETDFYQITINDKPQAEIEVLPKNKFGKPEILSLFVEPKFRQEGLGKILVNKILDIYLTDRLYVRTTKESKPFWLKVGAKVFEDDMCLFEKTSR